MESWCEEEFGDNPKLKHGRFKKDWDASNEGRGEGGEGGKVLYAVPRTYYEVVKRYADTGEGYPGPVDTKGIFEYEPSMGTYRRLVGMGGRRDGAKGEGRVRDEEEEKQRQILSPQDDNVFVDDIDKRSSSDVDRDHSCSQPPPTFSSSSPTADQHLENEDMNWVGVNEESWRLIVRNFGGGPSVRVMNVDSVVNVGVIECREDAYRLNLPVRTFAGMGKDWKVWMESMCREKKEGEWKIRCWEGQGFRELELGHEGWWILRDGRIVVDEGRDNANDTTAGMGEGGSRSNGEDGKLDEQDVENEGDREDYDTCDSDNRSSDSESVGSMEGSHSGRESASSFKGANPVYRPSEQCRYVVIEVAKVGEPWHRRNVKFHREVFKEKIKRMKVERVDARDFRGVWREGRILKIDSDKVRVDYVGYKGGSWYDIESKDLAPKGSYVDKSATPPPKQRRGSNLSIGRRSSNSPSRDARRVLAGVKCGGIGIANMGNTCYMNAAIQCVAHLPLFRGYLLRGGHMDDLNQENPLGSGGAVVRSFAQVVKDLHGRKSEGFIEPRAFRRALVEFKRDFAGHEQQDSQEFLSILLDAIHEDCNRVKQKPLVPSIEDSWADKVDLQRFGRESWSRHLRRNLSPVTSLFYGMSLSNVTCTECRTESRSFDPWNLISCPINTQDEVALRITVFRRANYINSPLVFGGVEGKEGTPPSKNNVGERYAISIPPLSDFGDIKLRLSNLTSIPASSMILCWVEEGSEVNEARGYEGRFWEIEEMEDEDSISSYLPGEGKEIPMIIGEAPHTITRLVVFEHTIVNKGLEDDDTFSESSNEEGDEENEEDWMDRIKRKFMKLYTSDSECAQYDTSPILIARIVSQYRWPREPEDIHESLLGLRFDMEDHSQKICRGQVIGKGSEPGFVKIHYDRYTPRWDREWEWVNFDHVKIRPLYMTRDPMPPSEIQRVKIYNRRERGPGDEVVDVNCDIDMPVHYIFGLTSVLHVHPEWTTARAGAHILAQVARFVSSKEATLQIGDIVKFLVEEDVEWYRKQLHEDLSSFNVKSYNNKFMKKLATKLKKLPFVLKAVSASNPGGIYGDEIVSYNELDDEEDPAEEDLLMSLINCFGNVFNSRLCVVVHWKTMGSRNETCYQLPSVRVHDKSEKDIRKMEEERGGMSGEGGGLKLESCLREYFKEETLGVEEHFWMCPKCKDVREGMKATKLWKCPDLLIIHLKRFNASSRWKSKIRRKVDFPLVGLDLSPFIHPSAKEGAGPDACYTYDCCGVINHLGGISGGHYVAHVKVTECSEDGKENVFVDGMLGEGAGSWMGGTGKDEDEEAVGGREEETKKAMSSSGGAGSWLRKRMGMGVAEEDPKSEKELEEEERRRREGGFWVLADDEKVEEVCSDAVVSEAAYVLFYRKRNLSEFNVAEFG